MNPPNLQNLLNKKGHWINYLFEAIGLMLKIIDLLPGVNGVRYEELFKHAWLRPWNFIIFTT